jgi:hypothetical protein
VRLSRRRASGIDRRGGRSGGGRERGKLTERCGGIFRFYTFPPVLAEVHESGQRSLGTALVLSGFLGLAFRFFSGLALIGQNSKFVRQLATFTKPIGR